jgi:preprotein translocase subunit SecY
MESSDVFPDHIVCPNCDSELQLDDDEKKGLSLICPECKFVITKDRIQQSAPATAETTKPEGIAGQVLAFFETSSPLRNKILFTLAAIAVYRIGLQIPIPGVNTELLSAWMKAHGRYPLHGLFSQGITPYLFGSYFVLLLSALVPPLRRLREGNPGQHHQFDFFIYVAALAWSVTQAWGSYLRLEGINVMGHSIVTGGLGSQVAYIATAAAGTMLLVWIADKITEKGLANGVAVIILTDIIFSFYHSAGTIKLAVDAQNIAQSTAFLFLLIPVVLVFLSAIVVPGKRTIALARIHDETNEVPAHREPPSLPIRVMASGVMPFTITLAIMSVPVSYFSLQFTSLLYTIPYIILVMGISFMYIAVTYDPKDIVERLKRYGYRLAETQSDEEALAYLDTVVIRTALPGLALVLLFAVLPMVIFLAYHVMGNFFTKEVMVLCAISIPILQNIQSMRNTNAQLTADQNENFPDWVLLFTPVTVFEGELLRDILTGAGINSKLTANTVICATGTFAPWEICRPRFPAIMIHRRLGNGSVQIFVSAAQELQARHILLDRNISE